MLYLTKKMLHDTFVELFKRNSKKLTVKRITDHCGMSRNTFYYYYESLQALLEQVIREWLDGPEPEADASLYECLFPLVKACQAHRAELLRIARGADRRLLFNALRDMIARNVRTYARRLIASGLSSEKEKFLQDFFSDVSLGFFVRWFYEGMTGDFEPFANLLDERFTRPKDASPW